MKPWPELFSSYTYWIEINNNYHGLQYDLITTIACYWVIHSLQNANFLHHTAVLNDIKIP